MVFQQVRKIYIVLIDFPTEFQNIMVKVEDRWLIINTTKTKLQLYVFSSKLLSLKSTGEMQINFADYDINDFFSHFARTRLESIDLRLIDAQGKLIPSPGSLSGQHFQFFITYPLVFNDITTSGEEVLFLGQHVFCPSGYYTTNKGMEFSINILVHAPGNAVQTQSCTIYEEFKSESYQPAPDGTFTIK